MVVKLHLLTHTGGDGFLEIQSVTMSASRDASGTNYAVMRGIMECTKLSLFEPVSDRVSRSCLSTRYGENRYRNSVTEEIQTVKNPKLPLL